MRLLQVTYLGLMILFSSCAAKHLSTPDPIYGVDIQKVKRSLGEYTALNADSQDYDGVFYSKEYLNAYLLDKCKIEGKC